MTKRKTQTPAAPSGPATIAERLIKSPRPDTKFAAILERLRTPDGATIADMQAITGWQEHSIRGVLAGAFKKRFGLTIISEKLEHGRVYRVAEPDAQA